ncbi:MAG: class I SAM-dependent methyltransferase [Deltaproteobacteria bacterium]|nr:class I SAM-dependent methyltransferase [Deltaproteobacteria bacterium]
MALDLIHTPVCRWCGKGPLAFRFTFDRCLDPGRNPAEETFIMERCSACGSFQVNPHPGPELARSFFSRPDLYVRTTDPEGRDVDPVRRAEQREEEYRGYAAAALAVMPEHGTVVDFGAGTGLMLSLIPDRYRRIAVEPNPEAAAKARERGVEVSGTWAEDLYGPPGELALAIFNQSLDHFVRPDVVLGRVLNWIPPGGAALLTGLINPQSVAARLTGPMFRLWHPFHQVYPPRDAVTARLASFGFETVAVWRPYFRTPYGSIPALLKGAYTLTKAFLLRNRRGVPSPPWPGNTVSYLARKTLLYRPLPALEATGKPAKLARRKTGLAALGRGAGPGDPEAGPSGV